MTENTSKRCGLEGLTVLSLQCRHADQLVKLIENEGGIAINAPSMREVPIQENPAAYAFSEEILSGGYDVVIFLTGVGTRMLFDAASKKYPREQLAAALSKVAVVARGPKSSSALRELQVPITLTVPEPNTWRDILAALDSHETLSNLEGKRIAVQEYGIPNDELTKALEKRGATVRGIQVYQWALPENLQPVENAIQLILDGKIDVMLVTSAAQISNLMEVASWTGREEAVVASLKNSLVVSVGPIATEGLARFGIIAAFEPVHPKMGQLVYETAQKAKELLVRRRGISK